MTLALLHTSTPVTRESERAMLEASLIAALSPLLRVHGRYLRAVEHYNGEIDRAQGVEDVYRALLGRQPAILVSSSLASRRSRSISRTRSISILNLELLLVSAHLRSPVARNLGDDVSAMTPTADPGAYQMMVDIRKLLDGRRLPVAGSSPLVWNDEAIVIQVPEMTAWRVVYQTRVRLVQQPGLASGQFESVEHRHNLIDADPVNPVVVGESPSSA